MIYHVSMNNIPAAWGETEPLLQKAINVSQHDYDTNDVYHELFTGKMQLFVWVPEKAITAILITRISNRPRKKVCELPFIAGTDMKLWLEFEPYIVKFAQEQGCSELEGYCRDGWLRVLKNWRKVWTTMRREI